MTVYNTMIQQEQIYTLFEDSTDNCGVEEAAHLFTLNVSERTIRDTLDMRFSTQRGFEIFREWLLETTQCGEIYWRGYENDLVTHDGEKIATGSFEIEGFEMGLRDLLIEIYEDKYSQQKGEELAKTLNSEEISQPARILATIIHRHEKYTVHDGLNQSTLRSCLSIIVDEQYTPEDIEQVLDELIHAGAIAKQGSDIYVRLALTSLPEPQQHLPRLAPLVE